MSRPSPSPALLRYANLLALIALVGLLCFEWGFAEAERSGSGRRLTGVVEAVRHAAPAVVSVTAESRVRRGVIRRGSGSGVLVHPDGYIVTNSHVIRGGRRIRVQLWRDDVRRSARIVRNLPSADLAVLKIENGGQPLPYVSIVDPDAVLLGETAIAVGNPHGLGDTITVGVVSALGRDAKLDEGVALRGLVQTDAPINTGNSGGGLLNLDGELIGIIVSILPRASGIAFAIPGDQVRDALEGVVPALPAPNRLRARPPAGLDPRSTRGSSLPPPAVGEGDEAASEVPPTAPMRPEDFGFRLVDTGTHLRVQGISAPSAAAQAGLRNGDVFLSVDGIPVEDMHDVILAFSRSFVGKTYYLTVRRSGRTQDLQLEVP